jgi:hypothetical protein
MAGDLADQGWILYVEAPASGNARFLVGLSTDREAELAVRKHYPRETIRIVRFVRLSEAHVIGYKLKKGEVRPW